MQEHLHVGRKTFKRQLRSYLILFSPILFFAVFGFPFMRQKTSLINGNTYADYFFGAVERYEIVDGKAAPLLILVPLWWPHKNADGMKWVADTWDQQNWSDQK
jgi:hypothetical protein